jgi:hypothetical protein
LEHSVLSKKALKSKLIETIICAKVLLTQTTFHRSQVVHQGAEGQEARVRKTQEIKRLKRNRKRIYERELREAVAAAMIKNVRYSEIIIY